MEIQHRCSVLWMVLISLHVCGGVVQFLRRGVGEAVVIQCSVPPEEGDVSPFAVSLKRCWLRKDEQVLYKHTDSEASVGDARPSRVSVSGDPRERRLNVTLSALRADDTDRYCCTFVVEGRPFDRVIRGEDEFFVYVADDPSVQDHTPPPPQDDPGSADAVHILETHAGGAAMLPCTRPPGEAWQDVKGYSLKRQRSSGPVELLYHHDLASDPTHPSSSPFPPERLRLTPALAVGRLAFNLTLLRLQPRDSGFYSCTLLPVGRPQAGAGLGSRVFYVSVQEPLSAGGQCDCSTYTTLLYALFAGVAVTLPLLMVVICRVKACTRVTANTRVKPQAQIPIYEEMVGVRSPESKLGPCGLGSFHLEEAEGEYNNSHVAKHRERTENHYESPCLARIKD